MDDLLREHARHEIGPLTAGSCRPAWRVLLDARRKPEELRRWWSDHGRACPACHAVVERVGEAACVLDIPRVIRLFGSATTSFPWAAASGWIDPHAPLPRVAFRRLAATHGTGVMAVWCVSCDEQLLLILCGPGLDTWAEGACLLRDVDNSTIAFAPADALTTDAFCPRGRFRGAPALCLVCREPLAALTHVSLTLPGLVRGRLRIEPLQAAQEPGEETLLDLVQRNRAMRFLRSLENDLPGADQRATCEFYLRLLLRQGRVPREEQERLRSLSWLTDDVRDELGANA